MNAVEEVLSALADPTRRDLLEKLSMYDYATATTLANLLPISRQAVVQHLAVLDEAGLVRGQRSGRERRFAVRPERLSETAQWMTVLARQWEQRLSAIKRLAEAT
jgi:DNA-binding transcriptional ArsR family regulator